MRFPFNEKKATQAAAFLLKRHNASLNYMLLTKLLYYADREALLKRGAPITGDQMVSMDYGPVLSAVLDFIKHTKEPGPTWRAYIETAPNYVVNLLREPEIDELSPFEIQTLAKVDEAHGSKDPFDLSNESHSLPEWRDPHGSSVPIQVEELFEGEKKSEEIADVAANARVEWFFRDLEEND
jgi:uncharacterized phage-associated protein